MVIASANVPRPVMQLAIRPSASVTRGVMLAANMFSQRFVFSCMQYQHWPHAGTNDAITRSPGCTLRTSAPTDSTVPAPSWPSTHGGGRGTYP